MYRRHPRTVVPNVRSTDPKGPATSYQEIRGYISVIRGYISVMVTILNLDVC